MPSKTFICALSVCPHTYLSFIYILSNIFIFFYVSSFLNDQNFPFVLCISTLSLYLSITLPLSPYLSTYLSLYLCLYLTVFLISSLSIYLPFLSISTFLSINQFILSSYLHTRLWIDAKWRLVSTK